MHATPTVRLGGPRNTPTKWNSETKTEVNMSMHFLFVFVFNERGTSNNIVCVFLNNIQNILNYVQFSVGRTGLLFKCTGVSPS